MDVPDFCFTFVSERAELLLGYPLKRWFEEPDFWQNVLVHPEDREWAMDFRRAATGESRDHAIEYRAVRADGEVIWLRDLVRVVHDPGGTVRQLRGLIIDVTEEKRAQLELKKREAQFAEAQAIAQIGSWEWDLRTDTVTWSDQCFRMCGMDPHVVEPTLALLLSLLDEAHRARLQSAIDRTMATGESYCIEAPLRLPDGSTRFAQMRGDAVLDAQGQLIRLRGTAQDITERRATEEARHAAERVAQAMANRMRAIARAAAGVIGAESVDQLLAVLRDACEQVISLDAFWLSLYEEQSHTFVYAGFDLRESIPVQRVTAAGTPSERVILARESVVTHRSTDAAAAGAVLLGTGRRSESIIRTPILGGSRALGVVSVQSYTPDLYTQQDVEVLETIASLAATALLNIELREQREAGEAAVRRSESRFKALFERSPDPIFLLDGEVFIDCNQAAVDLMRYSSKDQILGRHPASLSAEFQLNGTESFSRAEAIMETALAEGSLVFEWLIQRADGEVFPSEVAITAFPLEDRQILHVVARDITGRKHAEQELIRLNEELEHRVAARTYELAQRTEELEAIFQALPDLYFRSDAEGIVRDYRSGSGEDLYIPPDVLLNRPLTEILPPELSTRFEESLAELRRTGELVCLEYQLPFPEGPRDYEARMLPLEDGSFISVVRNITDRKRFEEALRDREEWFRSLIENALDMVQVLDPAGSVIYISPSVQRILGYAPEELLGGYLMELLHPEDRALAHGTLEQLAADPHASVSGDFRLLHRDGSYRLLESFGRRISADEPERGIVVNARDITERKQMEQALQEREEHFRRLTENSSDLVQIIDAKGRIEYTGPSVLHLLGYTPEELTGRSALHFIHPADRKSTRQRVQAIVAAPGVARVLRIRVRQSDGSYRVFEAFGRTMLPDSAAAGLIINARDITERHEAEQELRQREEHFRRLIEMAYDMVMMVDVEGRMIYTSPSVVRILGYSPEELSEISVADLVHPDDLQDSLRVLERTIAVPGTVTASEGRLRHRDGTYRVVESFARTFADHSADQGVVVNARDITERKQFEEVLARSETRYRSLIENAHDIVTILDLEGRIIYQSPQLQRVLGYSPEEMYGKTAFDFVHPDDIAEPVEAVQKILEDPGATFSSEYRFRHRDGTWRYLETFGRALVPESPEQGLVFNTRDVTERREAQRILQEREEHFRKLIETSHDLVQTLDREGRIVYTGPSVERLLGYTPEEITGSGAPEFIHPDDHALIGAEMLRAMSNPGEIVDIEYRVLHKDGRWRWYQALARTLSPDTAEDGIVANARDITERREAEAELIRQREYFEQLITSVDAGIAAWDATGRFEYVSPSAVPDEEVRQWLVGRTHHEYCERQGLPRSLAELRSGSIHRAIQTRAQSEYEETIQGPDGLPVHLLRRNRPVLNEAGDVERVIGYSVDITARKRTEEAVQRATEEAQRAREAAEHANRAKSEFLSRMSHELRTPMNSILGFAQILDRSALSQEHRKGVAHILKAGRHLLQLINEVLEIARIEAGRHSLSLEPVRLGNVLMEAVGLVRPLAEQWQIELEEGQWKRHTTYVQADRQRLTQVLLNLLSNAIKYNRPGGRVSISCDTRSEGDQQRLVIRIEDTGRGIAPERADQLFTPFARLGAEDSGVEGTGLGLALSQRLTEAMGGSLTLERTGFEGSVFRLELLVTTNPLDRLEESPAAGHFLGDAPHAPATLLYIEDNLANLSLVETILLARPGWHTMPALQGRIGLELAREHVPDLILLDLHLPDISGEEVLRRLRADSRTASIPVVVITADATRAKVDRLIAAGADAYLTKPLDIDEFMDTLHQFLPLPE